MPISPFDSSIYRELLHDEEAGQLFSDAAEIEAMICVECALASAQGELGLIPADAASEIVGALTGLQIDPDRLAAGTAAAGVPVPALIAELRRLLPTTHQVHYLHWGATSQDIMDTGLVLRLRTFSALLEARLQRLLQALARQAEAHAELPLAARTRTQVATPTSFGAVVAGWGTPLLSHLEVLAQIRPRLLRVSLAGAAGNCSALGERAAELRALLARQLELADSEFCWHSDRGALVEFASLLTRINGSLAKIGADAMLAVQSEVGELEGFAGGGSSTMPNKSNPVAAEMLVSLFRLSNALGALMGESMEHRQQRDGVAWSLEWHALPQICMACARGLEIATALARDMQPVAAAMRANLLGRHGLAYAEAISFRLALTMPRSEAQRRIKELCAQVREQDRGLVDLVAEQFPDIDWHDVCAPQNLLGDAAEQARAFARRVREGR
jgi:3-carboxy-cis,cis-muconate cycloisomerase